jgi:hypothetical protein
LTQNSLKLIFYPDRHGLTRIDSVDSVLMERCGLLEKNVFLLLFYLFIYYYFIFFFNFKLFFNFFIFINNNRNKITFKKILVNPKLGYNKCDSHIFRHSVWILYSNMENKYHIQLRFYIKKFLCWHLSPYISNRGSILTIFYSDACLLALPPNLDG